MQLLKLRKGDKSHRGQYPGSLVKLFKDKVKVLDLESFEVQEVDVARKALREAKGKLRVCIPGEHFT